MRVNGLNNKQTNNTMAKKEVTPKATAKKAVVKKGVETTGDFNSRKESTLLKCEQAGVIQTYLHDINNSKNDDELNDVLMNNVELRPFMEQ